MHNPPQLMIKLKITFHGINKGREVMEWNLTPENSEVISRDINSMLTGCQLPRTILKIEMTEAPTNGNKAT